MQEYTIIIREALAAGLRPYGSQRNQHFMQNMTGCVPEYGNTHSLDELPLALTLAGEVFPFPQIVRLRDFVLVCGATTLYEYKSGQLTNVFSGPTAGWTWSFADFGDYVTGTNGAMLIVRDPLTAIWQLYEGCDIPPCLCMCEFNGQIIIGGPGEMVPPGTTGE